MPTTDASALPLIATILFTVPLPFAATFIVDGAVAAKRGRGPRGLLIAIGATFGIAIAGLLLWMIGREQLMVVAGPTAFPVMEETARILALIAMPVAALALAARLLVDRVRLRRRARVASPRRSAQPA